MGLTAQRIGRDHVVWVDFERVNGATGPIAVRGAEPGNSLVVEPPRPPAGRHARDR